jgi:hypothetical protein
VTEPTIVTEAELDAINAAALAACAGVRSARYRPIDWIPSAGGWTRYRDRLEATGAAQVQIIAIDVPTSPRVVQLQAIAVARQATIVPFTVELVTLNYNAGTFTQIAAALTPAQAWRSMLLGAAVTLGATKGAAIRVTSAASGDRLGLVLLAVEVP